MSLSNPCTLSYNGYTFPTETETLGFEFRMIEDAAGRTVTHTVVVLKIKAKILAGATQDTTLNSLRAALERPGGELVYSGRGQGEFDINTAGDRRDLAWGPKPRTLSWRPIGRDRAAEIVWVVEVALLNCSNAPFAGQVMEATYSLTISTDKGGYATRTHNGTIRIPLTRRGVADATIPDSADNYFDRWVPGKFPSFDRVITRTIDESKSKLTFSVTDTERAGHPLPDGVIECNASYETVSQGKILAVSHIAKLSATYEMAADRFRGEAWKHFGGLLFDKRQAEIVNGGITSFPLNLTVAEPEIYGRSAAHITLTYTLINGNPRGTIPWVPLSAMWRPVPGTGFVRWSESLSNGPRHHRGNAKLGENGRGDAIVDLCMNANPRFAVAIPNPVEMIRGELGNQYSQLKTWMKLDDKPPPNMTWLDYDCYLEVEEECSTMVHVPMPKQDTTLTSVLTSNGDGGFPHANPPFRIPPQQTPKPIIQTSYSPVYIIRLIGRGLRFAYEIPRPVLVAVGGDPSIPANGSEHGTYWRQKLVGWTTHPIYAAEWNLRFIVARRDGAGSAFLPIPGHPFQQGQP